MQVGQIQSHLAASKEPQRLRPQTSTTNSRAAPLPRQIGHNARPPSMSRHSISQAHSETRRDQPPSKASETKQVPRTVAQRHSRDKSTTTPALREFPPQQRSSAPPQTQPPISTHARIADGLGGGEGPLPPTPSNPQVQQLHPSWESIPRHGEAWSRPSPDSAAHRSERTKR